MGPFGDAPTIARLRRTFADAMGEALGTEVVTVVASSYAELGGLIERSEAQVAWLPPAVYVAAADRAGVHLVAGAVRAGSRSFRGALFVRADAPWSDVAELRNTRIAWVDRHSCAGYLFPRLALGRMGIDANSFFREELLFESHSAVARAVVVGHADVGATFVSDTSSGDSRRPADGARGSIRPEPMAAGGDAPRKHRVSGWTFEVAPDAMRELLVTDPIPSDTICAAPALDARTLDRIGSFFFGLHAPGSHDVLQNLFGVDRFVESTPDEYEVVRSAMAEIRSR
jgi:phosphonate transport system substrate-binding protein